MATMQAIRSPMKDKDEFVASVAYSFATMTEELAKELHAKLQSFVQ